MTDEPNYPYLIFYDGDCSVCRGEIDHYRRLAPEGRLRFVDIAAPDFTAGDYSRSQDQFMAQMHLRDAAGRWFLGVDAFTRLWRALPGRHWQILAALAQAPLLRPLARLAYRVFARNRHLLPRRQRCGEDHCDIRRW